MSCYSFLTMPSCLLAKNRLALSPFPARLQGCCFTCNAEIKVTASIGKSVLICPDGSYLIQIFLHFNKRKRTNVNEPKVRQIQSEPESIEWFRNIGLKYLWITWSTLHINWSGIAQILVEWLQYNEIVQLALGGQVIANVYWQFMIAGRRLLFFKG